MLPGLENINADISAKVTFLFILNGAQRSEESRIY